MTEIKRDKYGRPRVYLEEDCPVEELSIESQRERGASSALPPLYFLHVWWARRPLTVSRASTIGSLLPAGFDRKEFLELMGIPRDADIIGEKARINAANIRKEKLKSGFSSSRGFSNKVPIKAMNAMRESIKETWGSEKIQVLDSFAGGGSIPFESVRMGFDTIANELNPVASIIERATIEYPMKFGPSLAKDIETIGEEIAKKLEEDLAPFFPKNSGENIFAYIWTRTIPCPKCDLIIPLAPNWWLDTKGLLGYQAVVPSAGSGNECSFKIIHVGEGFDPEIGTVKRGIATCPRCGNVLDGRAIKEQAKAGNMGHQLAAIGYKTEGRTGRFFREALKADLDGVEKARFELDKRLPIWQAMGLVPDESVPEGNKTRELRNVGIVKWYQIFNDRQLLVHLTTLQALVKYPWGEVKDERRREALRVYLQLAFEKTIDYNSLQSRLDVTRVVVKNTFDRHDFAFKWSYGEIDGAGNLYRFGHSQISDAYAGIERLSSKSEGSISIINGDAANLKPIADRSVALVSIDPPYYDNVMYSECSDFFYVWMKRGIGDIFPEMFSEELTNKSAESVANPAQFKNGKRGDATKLAAKDYEAKMLAAFKEMHRVLKEEGVMTIMFTHKKVEAWDTMAQALLEAGFMITASWPIHTESEHSLHQAKKNAAASTILLVCRKRPIEARTSWWDDVQTRVDNEVRRRAEQFESKGLRGQDTFIACFGPALQVISENWPVKKKDGTVIRPDEALDRARETVSAWFMDRIAEGKASTLDPDTRLYILSWYLFHAREFPYDEARKLGLSLHVDIDILTRRKILEKKGDYVRILKPEERARKGALKGDSTSYDTTLDLVQSAMLAYREGQSAELKLFHQRTGALTVKGYKQAIEYLLDVLPRTEEVEEYTILNNMWETNYPDIKRRVINTDPTGEKQKKMESFSSIETTDEGIEEEPEAEESDDQ